MTDDDTMRMLRLPPKGKGQEIIRREMLQDRRLSFRDRGVLGYLLSLPPDWKTNATGIARLGGQDPEEVGPKARTGDGRDAVRASLRRLADCGYVARRKWHDPATGAWWWLLAYDDDPRGLADRLAEFATSLDEQPDRTADEWVDRADIDGEWPEPDEDAWGEPAGEATAGSSGDGEGKPAGQPTDGSSGAGSSGAGRSGAGSSGDIESQHQERPPTPTVDSRAGQTPDSGGAPPAPPARCSAHNRERCRACGHGTRAAAQQSEAEAEAERRRISRDCPWCSASPDNDDRVNERTRLPLAPRVTCDHVTPNDEFIAAQDARDRAEADAEDARRERDRAARDEILARPIEHHTVPGQRRAPTRRGAVPRAPRGDEASRAAARAQLDAARTTDSAVV